MVTLAAATIVISVKAVGVFFLSDDARKLQLAVETGGDDVFSTRIQFSIGPGMVSLAQAVSFFIDDIPPEARQALGALQEASVGIYELANSPMQENRARMMVRANEKMEREGWQRIVAVRDQSDTVLIYVPNGADFADDLRLCVTVWSGREIVIVSATVEPADLIEIVQDHEGFLQEAIPQLSRRQA
ncbi:MAG: hypothetical protein SynsKO_39730 [Synoicihabitans sp.]